MKMAARWFLAAALVLPAALSASQTSESAAVEMAGTQGEVTFEFLRPGLPVPHFILRVRADGTGSYQAEQSARSTSDPETRGEAAQHIDRPVTVSSKMAAKIFSAAHAANYFRDRCASKAKNIADTGTKTLSYSGPEGPGSCVYNYTENKPAVMLTNVFLDIATTLDEGRELEFLHRYDRLGLDAAMNRLSQAVTDGRALELCTISPILMAIADDTEIIQRVRLEAARLATQAQESR